MPSTDTLIEDRSIVSDYRRCGDNLHRWHADVPFHRHLCLELDIGQVDCRSTAPRIATRDGPICGLHHRPAGKLSAGCTRQRAVDHGHGVGQAIDRDERAEARAFFLAEQQFPFGARQ